MFCGRVANAMSKPGICGGCVWDKPLLNFARDFQVALHRDAIGLVPDASKTKQNHRRNPRKSQMNFGAIFQDAPEVGLNINRMNATSRSTRRAGESFISIAWKRAHGAQNALEFRFLPVDVFPIYVLGIKAVACPGFGTETGPRARSSSKPSVTRSQKPRRRAFVLANGLPGFEGRP